MNIRKVIDLDALREEEEINNKNNEYYRYLRNHISGVRRSFEQLFKNPNLSRFLYDGYKFKTFTFEELDKAIDKAESIIPLHDESKYSDEEFYGYRHHFYPTEKEKASDTYKEEDDKVFGDAVFHHYINNKHHSEYWCKRDKDNNFIPDKDIPLEYILEMMSDWGSMSVFKHSDMKDWWINHADEEKSHMTEKTISIINELVFDILPYLGIDYIKL